MKIPSNPKIPSADVMESFISGTKPAENEATPIPKIAKSSSKKPVKMYNVPFPPDVHRQAKINAMNDGISLAEQFIQAVIEYNDKHKSNE